MARPLTLLLVRHGQTEWNARGLMQGQTADIPLTDLGHAQASAAAEIHRTPRTATPVAIPPSTSPTTGAQGSTPRVDAAARAGTGRTLSSAADSAGPDHLTVRAPAGSPSRCAA
jgi:hypothetical protein